MSDKPTQSHLHSIVDSESLLWGDAVSNTYHSAADRDMNYHWDNAIAPVLHSTRDVDFSQTMDFACGHGRNTSKLLTLASHVTMVDVQLENLNYCRKLFINNDNVDYASCNGYDLREISSEKCTFFYCFDSMVHFDLELILSYMGEIYRVLKPTGVAFLHHSNYDKAPGGDFRLNPHWRNFMNRDIFRHLAVRKGFAVESQTSLPWGDVDDIDCISVLRRPA